MLGLNQPTKGRHEAAQARRIKMAIKPKPKREVSITTIAPTFRSIYFYASEDAVNDFRSFGSVTSMGKESYRLEVDARYDFQEVVEYIQNYG